MTYSKPELTVLKSALDAVEAIQAKDFAGVQDSEVPTYFNSAYEADE